MAIIGIGTIGHERASDSDVSSMQTYQAGKDSPLQYDLHFWLGEHTTLDQAATAAFKAAELDERRLFYHIVRAQMFRVPIRPRRQSVAIPRNPEPRIPSILILLPPLHDFAWRRIDRTPQYPHYVA